MDDDISYKKRRIKMDVHQCMEHAKSAEGLTPLKEPALVRRSSRDPNSRLYPQNHKKLLSNDCDTRMSILMGGSRLNPLSCNRRNQLHSKRPPRLHPFVAVNGIQTSAHASNDSRNLPGSAETRKHDTDCGNMHISGPSGFENSSPENGQDLANSDSPEIIFECAAQRVNNLKVHQQEMISQDGEPYSKVPRFLTATQAFNTRVALGLMPSATPINGASRRRKTATSGNTLLNYFIPSPEKKASSSVRSHSLPQVKKKLLNPEVGSKMATDKENTSDLFTSSDAMASLALDEVKEAQFQDPFGLFGLSPDSVQCTDDTLDETPDLFDYFAMLPIHIFELILCRLPILDLLLVVNRVNQSWNDTVSNERFIPWKKNYYKLKSGRCPEVSKIIQHDCSAHDMNNLETCLVGLIRYMRHFNLKPSDDMVENLKKCPKYQWAEDIMKERISECIINGQPHPWSLLACQVILSETVADVYALFDRLLHIRTKCSTLDIIECLYCIATFLLYFKNTYKLNHGLHYRVFYALYMYENESVGMSNELKALHQVPTGQQSIIRYSSCPVPVRLTHEQMRVVNHDLQPGQVVKIIALAGTGKTSTLVEYTKLRPGLKFLTIVYNKAVQEHATKCFPRNVECRTAHSLAWASVGHRYKSKLTTKLRPLDVIPHLHRGPSSIGLKQRYARCVLYTLDTFMASRDDFITTAHVSSVVEVGDPDGDEEDFWLLGSQDRLDISLDAEDIWKKMANEQDYDVRITHDGYLKLYQLEKPKLFGYDCILIDEAQDCSGAMLDIILLQDCPKIFVGDPNQQIYAFRGAVNALATIESTHKYHLTKSFRFGPDIAYVASCALEVLKKVDRQTLVGTMKSSTVDGTKVGQIAYIARSNVALFHEAVRLCCDKRYRPGEPTEIHGAFAGGISGYGLDQILDIYHLMLLGTQKNRPDTPDSNIKDRFIKRFKSFAALQAYAKNADDGELRGKIRIVLMYNSSIPQLLLQIQDHCKYKMDMANVVFSTAHKSKGLEFDTVCILDDFTVGGIPFIPNPQIKGLSDEYNVLYVAVTRAKKSLCMAFSVYCFLLAAQEHFEHPVSTKFLFGSDATLHCARCDSDVTPESTLTIAARAVTLANNISLPGGPLCTACITDSVFNLPAQLRGSLEFNVTPHPLVDNSLIGCRRLFGPSVTETSQG